jgi:hypothetical protein
MSHSYLKNTSDVGKKTALKLLNKYADSFNSIKEENKQLKIQIEDLNSNLQINKSIIESFFSNMNSKEKESSIISKIKQENTNLYKQNEDLRKKIEELNSKISINQQNYLESTTQTKEENEHLKTKIFMMEQIIQKKDNIINRHRTKLSLYKNGFVYNQREIYVTNPSKIINEINNELLTYKEMNEKNNEIIKDTRTVLERYEKQIIELQNENQLLRQEYKMHIFNTNREREALMTTIQKERVQLRSITEDNAISRKNNNNYYTNYNNDPYDINNKIYGKKNILSKNEKNENEPNKNKKNSNKNNSKKFNEKKNKSKTNNIKVEENDMNLQTESSGKECNIITTHGNYLSTDPNRLKISGDSRKKNFIYGKGAVQIYKDNYFLSEIENKQYEHEEFIDIIKSVGLSLEKYEELTKVKFFSEFTEIIEMLLNLIKEKEKVINILQSENDNLNANNFKLNKDNMFLFNQNINLKKELTAINSNKNNSMMFKNNLNKINEIKLNPKIKDSMHNYKEYLNINQIENRQPTDDLLNIKRVIIESSLDMESSTLKEKFEKEKERICKDNKSEETSISNGISNKLTKEGEKPEQKGLNELFVKPILEKNEENVNNDDDVNENLRLDDENEKNDEDNINIRCYDNINNDNLNNKKITNSNKKNINNKYMGTIVSVTSSEFREGCPGIDSFLSTMKFDETKKN